MFQTEMYMVRSNEMQAEVPAWARAEKMEMSTSQQELWGYSSKVARIREKAQKKVIVIRKEILRIKFMFLFRLEVGKEIA